MAKKRRKSSSGAKKKTARKSAKRRKAAKRELIKTGRDARFVRRRSKGRFKESDDVGRSLPRGPPEEGEAKGPLRLWRQGRPVNAQ